MVAEDDDQNRIGFHLEEIVVSYITNQWVKMNPFEAAARLNELERENAAMRAAAVETCALARVWVTVWGDKFSDASLLRFTELEEQILNRAKP